ncbi:very low-density lipo receptor-like, partial [Paramuricea clavata]
TQTVCQYWQFRCANGYQCVNRYYKCDGWIHCSDGSDEWYWNCGYSSISSIKPSSTANVQGE